MTTATSGAGAQATFENWQSEFLQVFIFIVLTTFLVHRHSHESPDTDYQERGGAATYRGKARCPRAKGGYAMTEQTVDAEQVRDEHLKEVNEAAHWAYVFVVLVGGTVLMLALIAFLGA